MTSYGYIIMIIIDSCMIWFHFDCIMQLKKSYYIATNVCSRKSATTFGDLPDCLVGNHLLIAQMYLGHCLSALFQLHLHSIINLTPGFNGLDKDNYKTRRETFKFFYLVWLILEVWGFVSRMKYFKCLYHCVISVLRHDKKMQIYFRVSPKKIQLDKC